MHSKNKTGLKTLDRLAAKDEVKQIYQDNDGIWLELMPGYNFEGQSGYRTDDARTMREWWHIVEAGEPY